MNIRVLNKIAMIVCWCLALATIGLANAGAAVAGQEVAAGSPVSSIIGLYQNYNNARYAVQWKVSPETLSFAKNKIARYEYLVLYSSERLLSSTVESIVQFGFFKSKQEAQAFSRDNQAVFPGLKVVSVSLIEHQSLFELTRTELTRAEKVTDAPYFWISPNPQWSKASLQRLLNTAKNHYVNKQYAQALRYYSLLSLAQDAGIAIWARELMAVCYERLGKNQLATSVYKQLLFENPESRSAARITQRLRILETAASDLKEPLRKSKNANQADAFHWRGVIGQTYNQVSRGGQYVEDQDVLSMLISNFDLHAGLKSGSHDLSVRLNGYDLYDMSDDGDSSDTQVKRFYMDYTHTGTGLNIVGGRQKDFNSGVYTSFDGVTVRYPLTEKWSVGASVGVPVYFSDFADYIDRQFYTLHSGYELNERWSITGYFTQQTFYDELERSAVGGRVKYVSSAFNSYLNLDYDVEFQELNVFRWSGTYVFSRQSQATITYGLQRAPFLTASNIQIGQPYLNVEEYIQSEQYNHEQLLFDALQRTSIFEYGSFSYQYQFDDDLQLIADLYQSVSSEVPNFYTEDDWLTTSVDDVKAEYVYSSAGIQAVAHSFFGKNDTAILSFRHADSTFSSTNILQVSEQLRFGKKLAVRPKLMLSNTTRKNDDAGQTRIRGNLVTTYRLFRNTELRAEIGSEVVDDLEEKRSIDTTYLILGYHARF